MQNWTSLIYDSIYKTSSSLGLSGKSFHFSLCKKQFLIPKTLLSQC